MRKHAIALVGIAALTWSGCGDRDPVSSQEDAAGSPLEKVVAAGKRRGRNDGQAAQSSGSMGRGSTASRIVRSAYQLPKFTQPPVLDGDRFSVADEWANALEQNCSPSQVLKDGRSLGWRNVESQESQVSANQLAQSEGEDAAVARTDGDASATIWQAWDDEAFYYIAEVRDNTRDVTGGESLESWWERDSISLYVDLNNENTGGDDFGSYTNLNIVNFVAAPQSSSPVAVTLETTVENARQATQSPSAVAGFTYGFRDAGSEFGGEADYAIEGKMEWDTFLRANLNQRPEIGALMGYSWILLDPDGDEGYGGQIQCVAWATEAAKYADWIFSDIPAGPGAALALKDDSWRRIQNTFAR